MEEEGRRGGEREGAAWMFGERVREG